MSRATFITEDGLEIFMESIFLSEPVVSMSVSHKNSMDCDDFVKRIAIFTKKDSTFRFTYVPQSKVCHLSSFHVFTSIFDHLCYFFIF